MIFQVEFTKIISKWHISCREQMLKAQKETIFTKHVILWLENIDPFYSFSLVLYENKQPEKNNCQNV